MPTWFEPATHHHTPLTSSDRDPFQRLYAQQPSTTKLTDRDSYKRHRRGGAKLQPSISHKQNTKNAGKLQNHVFHKNLFFYNFKWYLGGLGVSGGMAWTMRTDSLEVWRDLVLHGPIFSWPDFLMADSSHGRFFFFFVPETLDPFFLKIEKDAHRKMIEIRQIKS